MRPYAAVLFVTTLAVTSAEAAEVTPAAQSMEDCATHAVPTAVPKVVEAKGRMPVRGMDHFMAIYARSAASADESTASTDQQAAVVVRVDESRS